MLEKLTGIENERDNSTLSVCIFTCLMVLTITLLVQFCAGSDAVRSFLVLMSESPRANPWSEALRWYDAEWGVAWGTITLTVVNLTLLRIVYLAGKRKLELGGKEM